MLVRFHDVSKSFGSFDVLQNVSFEIHPGNKVGLIGANGAGKTTLLELVQKPDSTDSGTVTAGSGIRIGRLDQLPDFGETKVMEVALDSFKDLQRTERRLREMEEAMAADGNRELLDRYSQLQQEFEFHGGYSYRARTEGALFGMGFSPNQFDQPAGSLSGGERNRLALARLLLDEADLLLLDEPTNHLDIRSIEWLERYLRETDKSLLIVSHDRFFLDRVVSRVLELDSGKIYSYSGNYSAYVKQRNQRLELQEKEWQRQQEWIEKTQDYIRRNLAGQKTKQAQSRRKALARIQPIEKTAVQRRESSFSLHALSGNRALCPAHACAGNRIRKPIDRGKPQHGRGKGSALGSGRTKRFRQDNLVTFPDRPSRASRR